MFGVTEFFQDAIELHRGQTFPLGQIHAEIGKDCAQCLAFFSTRLIMHAIDQRHFLAFKSFSGSDIRIIIREERVSAQNMGKVSFPTAMRTSDERPYTKGSFFRDEDGFDDDDDDSYEEEVLPVDALVARFDLGHVQKAGAVFDRARLEWLNGQWIRRLASDDLVERLRPFLEAEQVLGTIDRVPADDELLALMPIVQERLPTLAAIVDLVGFLWTDDLRLDPALVVPKRWDAATTVAGLRAAGETLAAHDAVTWEAEELEPPLRALADARGWKAGDLFMAIRVATTGRTATPPLFDTLVAIGREARSWWLVRGAPVEPEVVLRAKARALSAGGTVAEPKMPIPGMAWLAYCLDTEGNLFGMYQEDTSAA